MLQSYPNDLAASPFCVCMCMVAAKVSFHARKKMLNLFDYLVRSGPARAESAGSRTFPTLSSNEEGFHTSVNISWSNRKSMKPAGEDRTNKNNVCYNPYGYTSARPTTHNICYFLNKAIALRLLSFLLQLARARFLNANNLLFTGNPILRISRWSAPPPPTQ